MRYLRYFDYGGLIDRTWDNETVNLPASIHEAKGRGQLFLKQKQATPDRLVELAMLRSTEASNAIEGIRTTQTRLKQLVTEQTAPRNRDEREILGYRDALKLVHESFEYIPITPAYILQLHKVMSGHTGSAHGGRF